MAGGYACRTGEQIRRIGVLIGAAVDADDPDVQANIAAFLLGLQQLGWTDGRNVRIDYRWGAGNADNIRKHAAELVALAPDVILANGTAAMAPLLQATRTLPIVFTAVADPVGAGFVDSLARPGGNTTGFMQFEYNLSGKWLELLKQIVPGLTRAAILRDAAISSGTGQLGAIQSVAPSLGVELSPIKRQARARSGCRCACTTAAFSVAPSIRASGCLWPSPSMPRAATSTRSLPIAARRSG